MSVVAVCTAGGSTGSTTTALLLAAMAPSDRAAMLVECDPDGGDVAAWAELSASRGWSSAVSATDRSWSGLVGHSQELPGLTVVVSPTRPSQARSAVREAASGFAGLLAGMPDASDYSKFRDGMASLSQLGERGRRLTRPLFALD